MLALAPARGGAPDLGVSWLLSPLSTDCDVAGRGTASSTVPSLSMSASPRQSVTVAIATRENRKASVNPRPPRARTVAGRPHGMRGDGGLWAELVPACRGVCALADALGPCGGLLQLQQHGDHR